MVASNHHHGRYTVPSDANKGLLRQEEAILLTERFSGLSDRYDIAFRGEGDEPSRSEVIEALEHLAAYASRQAYASATAESDAGSGSDSGAVHEVSELVARYEGGEISGGRGMLLWLLGQVSYPIPDLSALEITDLSEEEEEFVLELAQGLPVVDPRSHVQGMTMGEVKKAVRLGREPDRRVLERRVRRCAYLANDEEHYEERLAADSLDVKPHYDPIESTTLIGYSVTLPVSDNNPDPIPFGSQNLAKDLTLGRLRAVWSERWGLAVDDPRLRSVWSRPESS
ncbi:MAG: hypothetical protein ACRD0E_00635 [Acidimicrobiales bacterium]